MRETDTEERRMVRYCNRCGKDNQDEAAYCRNCGAPMVPEPRRRAREWDRDSASIGGTIAGVVFGMLLIFVGVTLYEGWSWNWTMVIAAFFLLLGALLVVGAFWIRRRPRISIS